jgi:Ca2+-binding EF-hand superfamily protein
MQRKSEEMNDQLKKDSENQGNEEIHSANNGALHYTKIEMIDEVKKKFPELSNIESEEAEECLIYGMDISLFTSKAKVKDGIAYTIDEDSLILLFPKSKKNKQIKIFLLKVTDISRGKVAGNFKRVYDGQILEKYPDSCCLTIHYDNNFKYYNLIFKSERFLHLFVLGILRFLKKTIIEEIKMSNTDLISLKKIWKEYDPNHNKFLNQDQFCKFLQTINFQWKKKKFEQIFQEIDSKKEGIIRFKDFISFYELIVTGEEFREVFQKYSSDQEKKYISVRGLSDFFEKEQHIKLSSQEVLTLMARFSKKTKKLTELMKSKTNSNNNVSNVLDEECNPEINEHNRESMLNIYENHSFGKNNCDINFNNDINLSSKEFKNAFTLNFREFVNMLIDKNFNAVFNHDYFSIYQNMNMPLYNYFIYSSHNTYLEGNQINSKSTIEMYYCALKNGCRLIELDCWDGRNGVPEEPIITHWHFPVGELNLREVLVNVKENAFKKSEFPVVLSIENHCSRGAQLRMDKYFREVLGVENLYILDPQNPPLNYPSPMDLKRKFVIKCKRKRIFGNFEKITNDKEFSQGRKSSIDRKFTGNKEEFSDKQQNNLQPDIVSSAHGFRENESYSVENKFKDNHNLTSPLNINRKSFVFNSSAAANNHNNFAQFSQTCQGGNLINLPGGAENNNLIFENNQGSHTSPDFNSPYYNEENLLFKRSSINFVPVEEVIPEKVEEDVVDFEENLSDLDENAVPSNIYTNQLRNNSFVFKESPGSHHVSEKEKSTDKLDNSQINNNSSLIGKKAQNNSKQSITIELNNSNPEKLRNLNLNLNVNTYNITNNYYMKDRNLPEKDKQSHLPIIENPEEKNINKKSEDYCNDSHNQISESNKKKKSIKRKNSYNSVGSAEKEKMDLKNSQPTNSNQLFKKLKLKYLLEGEDDISLSNFPVNIPEGASNVNIQAEIIRIKEIKNLDDSNLNKPKIKTIDELATLVGMVGVKYKREDFENSQYLRWECISVGEPDFEKYLKDVELKIKIVKFCQKAFMKTYPDVVRRTDSTNHDPIQSWAVGVQIAALNLQKTDDDAVLINKIFFKINGGSKCGYMLKPDILLNPNCDESLRKMFWKPVCKIKIKILSGFHLHFCFPKGTKISGIFVEVTLRGPNPPNQKNESVILTTDTISNNFLHPVWQSNSKQFEIYDPDLSFFVIKLYSNKRHVLARSVIPVKILRLGYRVLDLYDNICSKFDSSFLIVKTNKIFLN